MRRRVPDSARFAGKVPPELQCGRLIEVWADDGRDWHSAWRRFTVARRAWCDEHGLSTSEGRRRLPVSPSPWSADYLVAQGRRAEVERRLAEAGVTLADIPALRRAAQTYPD